MTYTMDGVFRTIEEHYHGNEINRLRHLIVANMEVARELYRMGIGQVKNFRLACLNNLNVEFLEFLDGVSDYRIEKLPGLSYCYFEITFLENSDEYSRTT